MKKLMRRSGAVLAAAEAAVARFPQLFLPPPPRFLHNDMQNSTVAERFCFHAECLGE
ncbi:MAG: hypothetical protein ACR2PV_03845 [Gammaproteobacteria bacterium]